VIRPSPCLAFLILAASLGPLGAAAETPPAPANTVSLAEYRTRLQSLDQLIVACQRAMTPANCQGDQVGSDLKLALPSGARQVRFGWLRELLESAGRDQAAKDKAAQDTDAKAAKAQPHKTARPPLPASAKHQPEFHRPTLVQQLADARQRLAADMEFAGEPIQQAARPSPAFSPPRNTTPPSPGRP
jgi:hypothetical protein